MIGYRALGTAIAVGLACTPAAADAASPPATPEQIAAAHAEADALIAATGAPDLFANRSQNGSPIVRHLPSNLICIFDRGSPNNRLEIGDGEARANQVVCLSEDKVIKHRLSAVRAAPNTAEEERAALGARAIGAALSTSPSVKSLGSAFAIDNKPYGAAFAVEGQKDGRKASTWVGALDAGQWALTEEVTTAYDPAVTEGVGKLLLRATFMRLGKIVPS